MSVLSLPEGLVYDAGGLIPVIVQDRASGDVLMLAYANADALARTAETGLAHFWSRSRRALWRKGETSGHSLHVRALRTDCDRDALLMVVDPAGPACHTGTRACFGDSTPTEAGLPAEIERVIAQRAASGGDTSYTVRLLAKGLDHALKKVGEEATEFVLAAKGETDDRLAQEGADLLFHLMVVLAQRGVPVVKVMDVLRERRNHP